MHEQNYPAYMYYCIYGVPVHRRLSDLDQDGCLNAAEFAVAMHLIRVVLRDHTPLPATCPAPIQGLVKQSLYPQLPVATQAHLDKCRKAFGAFFENVGHGVLGGQCYNGWGVGRYRVDSSTLNMLWTQR